VAGRPAGEQRRDGLLAQLLPGGGVAEEVRHPDQQLLEEQIQLLRVLLQEADVGGHPGDLMNPHAAFNPAVEGVPFVEGKIMPGMGAQQDDRFFQGVLRLVRHGHFRPGEEGSALQIGEDLPGNSSTRATMSANPASTALRGMASNLAVAGSCTSATPAFSLMARRPSVPSEPMPERITPMLCSCRSCARERRKNQSAGAARGAPPARASAERRAGWTCLCWADDIDAVRPHLGAILDLEDFHAGGPLQQFRHDPLMRRVQVLDNHKRHAAAAGTCPRNRSKASSPGGGANADDGE